MNTQQKSVSQKVSKKVNYFHYSSVRNVLKKLRSVKSFLFYILPFSLLLGFFLPKATASLNSLGLTLIQLISFPAIPLILAAVIISTHAIFSLSKTKENDLKFTRNLFTGLITLMVFVSVFALLLALYQKPGILSPDGKLSIGRFMLDVTDIHLTLSAESEALVDPFQWIKNVLPINILGDASQGKTLKVISGSFLLGWGLSLLPSEKSEPLLTFIRSVYDVSLKVLDELLMFAPLVIVCLIAGSFATISSEMIVALLNLAICMLLASIASLGISRLIFKRFTTSEERRNLVYNPADKVFLLGLSTGSSLACYPAIVEAMEEMNRNSCHSEVSASLSLLVARMGNIIYNIIAIMFALNLFDVKITPFVVLEVLFFGIVTGISSAGLNGVSVVPTIALALTNFEIPVAPILVLLLAIDPILTLPRAATTSVLSLAISTLSSARKDVSVPNLELEPSH